MNICGTTVSIGMSQTAVLAAVERQCKVQALNDDGSFVSLLQRSSIGSGSLVFEGSLSFEKARLVLASRDWISTTNTEVAKAMYGAVNSLEKDGKMNCVVSTHTANTPAIELREVILECGDKRLTLAVYAPTASQASTQLRESLR
jgi:hypothetical protein